MENDTSVVQVCTVSKEISKNVFMSIVQCVQLVLTILTLIQLYFTCNMFPKSGGVFIILNCVCILVVHSVHQFIYHFQNAPCGAFFVRWQCLTMRGMGYLAIVGFNHTQFAFFLERCLAVLFVSKYEYSMKYAGAVLVVVLWATSGGITIYTFMDEKWLSHTYYCGGTSLESLPKIRNILFHGLFLNAVCLLGNITLYLYCRKQNKASQYVLSNNIRNQQPTFVNLRRSTLSSKFQIRENATTTGITLPLALVNSFGALCYIVINYICRYWYTMEINPVGFYTAAETAQLTICIYILATIALWHHLYRQAFLSNRIVPQFTRDREAALYFELFEQQIR